MRTVIVLALAMPLAGCGVAAKINARENYQQTASAYKQCLMENPSNPEKFCEGYRLAAEVDERQYNNFGAGISPGGQATRNINIQNR
jgi:hypothetical protein